MEAGTVQTLDWQSFPEGFGAGEPLFAVTDTHGAARELRALLERRPGNARLVFLGDAVDRGPDPLGVLHVLDEERDAVLLHGNHDIAAWLALDTGTDARIRGMAWQLWYANGGKVTHDAFVKAIKGGEPSLSPALPEVFARVYGRMQKIFTSGSLLFVHGGILPGMEDTVLALPPETVVDCTDEASEWHYAWLRPYHRKPHPVCLGGKPLFEIHGHTPVSLKRAMEPYGFDLDFGPDLKAAMEIDGTRFRLHLAKAGDPRPSRSLQGPVQGRGQGVPEKAPQADSAGFPQSFFRYVRALLYKEKFFG